jgi:toxin ParE1/3/4
MSYLLFIRKRAENQITEAYKWYEEKQPGLGTSFVECFQSSLHLIQSNPFLYPKKYKNIRSTTIQRFPYGVFYIVEKQLISVIAVLHLSRNPQLWQNA